MKTWQQAFRDGIVSGAVASLASTVALAVCGQRENGTPFGTTNAISRWFWGDHAVHRDHPSPRYTAVGYAIHHASSMLWATVYERWFCKKAERGEVLSALVDGSTVAAMACFVDYKMTPYRLEPGFNQRLSTPSMVMVYGSFGLALAVTSMLRCSKESRA